MDIFIIIMFICAAVLIVSAIVLLSDKYNKENNNTKMGIFYLVMAAIVLVFNFAFVIPTAENFTPVPQYSSSSKKEKCSWCGKMVYEKDMKNGWCEDCLDDAFGEDGWYNKLKD